MGGKYKLLDQLIPKMPDDIYRFVDIFGGGFNVGINAPAQNIIYNDTICQVSQLLQTLYKVPTEKVMSEIDELIEKFELSKVNYQGYLDLRNYYNTENNSSLVFYTLICYAFNNQIRFNSKGEFNMPFGKNRSSFNPSLRQKFLEFTTVLKDKNCSFFNKDFRELKVDNLSSGDFIYFDPPYLNTTAAYNENKGWTINDEKDLRETIIGLNNKGIRFGLSNNATTNTDLLNWAEENGLLVHHLNINYGNCNYQKKNKNTKDDEVYITNWQKCQ